MSISLVALRLGICLAFITGLVYPIFMTSIAHLFMHNKSRGDLLFREGHPIGSVWIGQQFVLPHYFWGRPSEGEYATIPSKISNLGPTSAVLKKIVEERTKHLKMTHGSENVPKDLLYTSGSGLDPHITLEAARFQIERVAKARGWSGKEKQKIADLVERSVEKGNFVLGSPSRINVLLLNLQLDALSIGDKNAMNGT